MSTPDEMLAEMAAAVVKSRKREFVETLALDMLAKTGGVDQAELNAKVAAEWKEPAAADVHNRVTAKAAAAVDYHAREGVAAAGKLSGAQAKVERLKAQLAAAEELVASLQVDDESAAATARQSEASAAYEAAVAAGGVAAPPGSSATARAEVSAAVGEVMMGS